MHLKDRYERMTQQVTLCLLVAALMGLSWSLRPLNSRSMIKRERRNAAAAPEESLDLFKDRVADTMSGTPSDYVFVPPDVGPEIYVGSIVALVPIVWATYEFTNRIRIQQKCAICQGSGLVSFTQKGSPLTRQRKCYNCGGFLPWLGWKAFFFSTFSPGNGGPLQRPSENYEANNAKALEQGPIPEEVGDKNIG